MGITCLIDVKAQKSLASPFRLPGKEEMTYPTNLKLKF